MVWNWMQSSVELAVNIHLPDIDENLDQDGTPFQYTRLKSATGIRLLEILPGTREDDIRCSMFEVDLDSEPDYEALSYCWGDCSDPSPIFINEMIIPIGRNLRSALFHLRLDDRSRVIWVDAVGINQADLDERSQQVSIMGKIYTSAARTVVWLGRSTDGLSDGLSHWRVVSEKDMAETGFASKKNRARIASKESGLRALRILSLPWWTRVWVVQEVALAKEVLVYCGFKSISWEDLIIGVVAAMENDLVRPKTMGFFDTHSYDGFLTIILAQNIVKQAIEDSFDRLTNFLTLIRGREATDARDRIFSSLGMLKDHDTGITPDYTSPVAHVFINSAAHILKHSRNLNILGHCSAFSVDGNTLNLPSWVPDWAPRSEMTSTLCIDGDGSQCSYSASRNIPATLDTLDNGRTLLLSGHPFDIITDLAPPLREFSFDNVSTLDQRQAALRQTVHQDPDSIGVGEILRQSFANFTASYNDLAKLLPHVTFFIDWEKFANVYDTQTLSASGDTHLEVYFRTLCGDWMPDGYDATKALFRKWYDTLAPVRAVTNPQGLASKLPKLVTNAVVFRALKQFLERKDPDFSLSMAYLTTRRLGRTAGGYLCAVPEATEAGDHVCLFKGGKVPLVVRPDGEEYWKLVGETFVYGIMNGEKFGEDQCVDFRMR